MMEIRRATINDAIKLK